MLKWVIIVGVIVALGFLLAGCGSNRGSSGAALNIDFENKTGSTLWVDIVPGNTRIEPMFSTLDAGKSITVKLTPDIFGSSTAGFNFYDSPAKLNKKAIVVVRGFQVFVRQCRGCKVNQPSKLQASVLLAN